LDEEACAIDGGLTLLGNGEGEVGVRFGIARCFTSIEGGVYFQANVEVLPGQEVDLVGREDTSWWSVLLADMLLI